MLLGDADGADDGCALGALLGMLEGDVDGMDDANALGAVLGLLLGSVLGSGVAGTPQTGAYNGFAAPGNVLNQA